MQDHELIVIGGGIAGLTAAYRSAELGLRCLAFTGFEAPGGLLSGIESIQDLPEHPEGIAGYDLGPMAQEAAMDAGATCLPERVTRLERDGDAWRVHGESTAARARAVVLAMGARLRALGVPGETELAGKGVSHCASCDAPLLRGRPVAVVGGGDSACQEALTIAAAASVVHLVVRGATLRARAAWQQRIAEQPKIVVHRRATVRAIGGDATGVNAIELQDGQRLDVHGVFAYVGLEPAVELVHGLVALDATGRIVVDGALHTTAVGLVAAGTLRAGTDGQAAQAIADGRLAAGSAHAHLQSGRWPTVPPG